MVTVREDGKSRSKCKRAKMGGVIPSRSRSDTSQAFGCTVWGALFFTRRVDTGNSLNPRARSPGPFVLAF